MTMMLRFSKHPRTVAVVVLVAVFMTNLDLLIVNVALPAMGATFSGGAGSALVNSVRQLSVTVGVAVLVAVVGSHVGAASRPDFRIVWCVAAVLGLSTSAIGVHLSRGGGSGRTASAASKEPEADARALADAS